MQIVQRNIRIGIAIISAAALLLTHNLAIRALLIGVASAMFLAQQKLAAFRQRFFFLDMPEAV